ncbi:MAG TPA: ADOP family duplicated permease [Gemmatimonadaceae bacterium]|jgi:predicted permease
MNQVWRRLVGAWRLVSGLLSRRAEDRAMRDEMQFHIDMSARKRIALGMASEVAYRDALVAFGGVERWGEAARDQVRSAALESVGRDVRYALRGIARHKAFSATAIVTLALGLAAAGAVFTMVDSLFMRPLAVPEGSRLVRVNFQRRGGGTRPVGLPAVELLRRRAPAFDAVIAEEETDVLQLRVGTVLSQRFGAFVSANEWNILGLHPLLGRFFTAQEDSVPDRDAVGVISAAFWHAQFGDDPQVIGRHVRVGVRDVEIIGVAGEGYQGTNVGGAPIDIWLPFMMAGIKGFSCVNVAPCPAGNALARLAPNATIGQARSQVRALGRELSALAFGDDSVRTLIVAPATGIGGRAEYGALARLLSGVAIVMLLIACANLSALLIGRGVAREREMAVRISLGAGRARLVRQLVTEGLLIGVAGGALGGAVAGAAARGLMGFFTSDDEGFLHFFDLSLDWRVVGFMAAASVAATVLFSLLPALTVSNVDPAQVLKRGVGAAPRARLRFTLTAAQVALATVLLSASGMLVRSYDDLVRGQHFDARHVALLRVRPDLAGVAPARAAAELQQMVERLRELPDVRAVAYRRCCGLLWSRTPADAPVGLGTSDTAAAAQLQFVSPGFFAALDIPMRAGREFAPGDRAGAPAVAVVSETLARRLWGRQSRTVVGRLVRADTVVARVVGVVPDYQVRTSDEMPAAAVFLPYLQHAMEGDGDTRLAVRVGGDPARAIPVLRAAMARVDPAMLVTESMPMRDQVDAAYVQLRLGDAVLAVAGGVSLLLCALGLYGVIAFLVARHTREIGIRVALGATAPLVVRHYLGAAVRPVAIGVVVGLAIASMTTRLLGAWLVGVSAHDVLSFALACAVVVASALVASYVPARRAARVDPATALRTD